MARITFEQYESDWVPRSAIERQFITIGEALGHALRHRPELEDRLSGAVQIIAFRNRLVHGYGGISNAAVWAIAKDHLPVLLREIEVLLREY